ncbi:MAG: hypothetical protein AAGA17_17565 [Actinomycetota bacterium]
MAHRIVNPLRIVVVVIVLAVSLSALSGAAGATDRFTTRKYCSTGTYPVMVATMTNTSGSSKTQWFAWSPSYTSPGLNQRDYGKVVDAGETETAYIHAGANMGGRSSATFAVHAVSGISFSYYTYCSSWL